MLTTAQNPTKLKTITKQVVAANQTVNEDKGISYKTQLESIAHIEINNLEADVITLDAVIKQSMESNSVYPTKLNDTNTEPNAVKNDTSTLPPTALFSEHEKGKPEKMETKHNEKKEEVHAKPQFQEKRPSVIKLRGANACETKEELLAPFWANNTRGGKIGTS
ncbi:hypothetical protein ACJJTC_005687 [Scirpophaga incertulas]